MRSVVRVERVCGIQRLARPVFGRRGRSSPSRSAPPRGTRGSSHLALLECDRVLIRAGQVIRPKFSERFAQTQAARSSERPAPA